MIKRSPQEIADFFQCYVAQDENGLWYINGCKPELKIEKGYWKPQRTPDDFEINIFSILVSAPADHDWTHLYEPQMSLKSENSVLDTWNQPETTENSVITSETGTNQQEEASAKTSEIGSNYQKPTDSDNKPDSYYQDSPKVDNKPGHLGEVYTHKEYEVVSTVSKPSLISTVNSLMKDGWRPQGGASYSSGLFYQAMVRGV